MWSSMKFSQQLHPIQDLYFLKSVPRAMMNTCITLDPLRASGKPELLQTLKVKRGSNKMLKQIIVLWWSCSGRRVHLCTSFACMTSLPFNPKDGQTSLPENFFFLLHLDETGWNSKDWTVWLQHMGRGCSSWYAGAEIGCSRAWLEAGTVDAQCC